MAVKVMRVEYYRTEVEDRPGQAYQLFSDLAAHNVDLVAVSAVPVGPTHTQFTLFPKASEPMIAAAARLNLRLSGPHMALLVQGDDRLGALVECHRKLADAKINVFAAIGVTTSAGEYAYVIHVRPDEFESAAGKLDAD